jgi:hypothetical protein
MGIPSLNVATLGLKDRENAIIKSLVSLLSGRTTSVWRLTDEQKANVLIISASFADSGKWIGAKKNDPNARIVLIIPEHFFPPQLPPNVYSVRAPVSASRCLEVFDNLERSFLVKRKPFLKPEHPAPASGSGLAISKDFKPTHLPNLDWTVDDIERAKDAMAKKAHASASNQTRATIVSPTISPQTLMHKVDEEAPTFQNLVKALELLRGPLGKDKILDIYNDAGKFARIVPYGKLFHALAAHLYIDRRVYNEKAPSEKFHWIFAKRESDSMSLPSSFDIVDFELFAWSLALKSCRDMAALDLPFDHELHLKQWPDFGAHPDFAGRDGVMKTVALLTRKSNHYLTAEEIHVKTGISQCDLTCLLGVCWLCGWLDIREATREHEASPLLKEKKSGFAGLIAGMRRALGLSTK